MNNTAARPASAEERPPRKTPTSPDRMTGIHPLAWLRRRWQHWWQSRLTPQDMVTLTQRNVYILPTRPGLMLGVTLLVLLVASINYQLNLGYLLTFLLAGSALVGMHVGHATLRGLRMKLSPPAAQFSGASATLTLTLDNPRRSSRWGIGLSVQGTGQWNWCDVPAQGSTVLHLAFQTGSRGLHPLPVLTAETRFPLGTFRIWTLWRPAAQLLVYPAPEPFPPPLPASEAQSSGPAGALRHASGEYDGVRPYRRGDPLKLIAWKKAAKNGELVSRDAQSTQHAELWLDLAQSGHALHAMEQRLSRLCAWVLEAEQRGLEYGLRLQGLEIKPGSGEAHKRRCLEALALC